MIQLAGLTRLTAAMSSIEASSGRHHSSIRRFGPRASVHPRRLVTFGDASALARSIPSGLSAPCPAVLIVISFEPLSLTTPVRSVGVDAVVLVRVQLVDDHERAAEAVQLRGVGGEHPEEAVEATGLVRVLAPAQLEVPDHDALVFKAERELDGRLEQDAGLRACASGDVHLGPLGGDEVVERDRGHQRRLALPAWEEYDELAFVARAAARAIRFWNGSRRSPTWEQNRSNSTQTFLGSLFFFLQLH